MNKKKVVTLSFLIAALFAAPSFYAEGTVAVHADVAKTGAPQGATTAPAQHSITTESAAVEASPSAAHASTDFNVAETIAHHLSDAPLWKLELSGYDISITKRVMMLFIGAFLLCALLIPLARRIAKDPYKKPTRFSGFVEVLINFIRNDVAHASLGHHSRPYEPFLLTLFFFILFANVLGLIPSLGEIYSTIGQAFGFVQASGGHDSLHLPLPEKLWPGITATGDIAVTSTLAVITLLVLFISGFAYQGPLFVRNIVPNGIPLLLWPIMWPIELLGMFTKAFALAIRLLANMTAGHMILIVLLGFIFQFQSYLIAPVSVAASVAIYLLEIFVAFLHAYIFTFLTSLFIAQVQHRH
ncbi:MAG TPA: F0F1 ATP synthase subunit A [Turneriella sp.]|nr:F0F1 ATP synthase subunit A [Turneriella sp.]